MSDEIHIARRAFDQICAHFPTLQYQLDANPHHVDLELNFPAQPDLLFDVTLTLQNRDELHLHASLLWVSWFPSSDPAVVGAFVEAVVGLISGEFRIVEHRRGRRTVRAELQHPVDRHFETLTGNSFLSFPWPRKRLEIVQNPRLEIVEVVTGAPKV